MALTGAALPAFRPQDVEALPVPGSRDMPEHFAETVPVPEPASLLLLLLPAFTLGFVARRRR